MRGMRPAHLMVPVFASDDPKHIAFSQKVLEAGVMGLMLMDCTWLQFYPQTPRLYESGVIYKPEKHVVGFMGRVIEYGEEWQTIPFVLKRGVGDCEDLASWRAAELRVRDGIAAKPCVKIRKLPSGSWRAHVIVKYPDGKTEDPSAKLGMYAYSS